MEEKERDKASGGEAAEGCAIILEQEVWSWGAGTEGQLGTGKLQDECLPQFLPSFSSLGPLISFISCGGAHAIALTPGGRVFTWGRGSSGQLGHGELLNSVFPKLVNSLVSFSITHASAGWNHSGFVSDAGCLYTCGDGSFGQLGHDDYQLCSSPVKVQYFASKNAKQIACGMRHSLVLLKGNLNEQVYGFGFGKRGQLGVCKDRDKIRSISLPQITSGLDNVEITSISANGDHSAALTADGHLYIWGRGFSGTLDVHWPRRVNESSSSPFIKASLGWNHALALTGDGDICMIGGSIHGTLGTLEKANLKHPSEDTGGVVLEKVTDLNGLQVVQIASGAEHSTLVTDHGQILTWGWGEHGQLGLGDTNDQTSPQVVNLDHRDPQNCKTNIYCGSGFTFVVRTCHVTPQ